MSAARWEAYFYPGSQVLKNKANIKDQGKLDAFEREVTALRIAQLRRDPIPPTFDLAHMKAIHRHIFQDVYEWAGNVRDVELSKGAGGSHTVFTRTRNIEAAASDLSTRIHSGDCLRGLSHEDFAREMGAVYTAINFLHPMREGNGRMTREFMTQLADTAGYELDYGKVDRWEWNEAATDSAHGITKPIERVFLQISTPKALTIESASAEVDQSASDITAELEAKGYGKADQSGPADRDYIGPIVAETSLHVAQDLGRLRAVIHDVRQLDRKPSLGERLTVQFKNGVGAVKELFKAGLERGR